MNLQERINKEAALLVYFSHDECNVCKVLKPKVIDLLNDEFEKIGFEYVNTVENKEIAAQNHVFTVPTVLVFFEGKESFRWSRNISIGDIAHSLTRPYSLLFE